ncbi:MAG: hypothetical protein WBZ33_09480 [Thermoactinomyces sp.]
MTTTATTFAMATETKATATTVTTATHTNHLLSKENKGSYIWDSRRSLELMAMAAATAKWATAKWAAAKWATEMTATSSEIHTNHLLSKENKRKLYLGSGVKAESEEKRGSRGN